MAHPEKLAAFRAEIQTMLKGVPGEAKIVAAFQHLIDAVDDGLHETPKAAKVLAKV